MSSEFRILIIEDNLIDEQLFKATLSPLSLNIDVARDGKEGYEKIKHSSYDLIILDLILPNTSGIELLRKANRENLNLPITIVCSALSAESYIMECLKLGASSYLVKPISSLTLLNSISDCLSLSATKPTVPKQPSPVFLDEKPLTLTKAMAEVTYTKKTGQILVDTHEGTGVLEYASGKLVHARFKDCIGITAIEKLRGLEHRSVMIQLVG
ncbi:MAG: response regulator [Chloroherpetonaceae bacterium]